MEGNNFAVLFSFSGPLLLSVTGLNPGGEFQGHNQRQLRCVCPAFCQRPFFGARVFILPAFLVGRRSFCHHLCWMAPFMIVGRAVRNGFGWSSLALKADPSSCNHCHICTRKCPMSLSVEEMVINGRMENPECILCGTCVDTCRKKALAFHCGRCG
jgi:NAD-dependent dihydropyrimidine dehydrogenase PreA subunit